MRGQGYGVEISTELCCSRVPFEPKGVSLAQGTIQAPHNPHDRPEADEGLGFQSVRVRIFRVSALNRIVCRLQVSSMFAP